MVHKLYMLNLTVHCMVCDRNYTFTNGTHFPDTFCTCSSAETVISNSSRSALNKLQNQSVRQDMLLPNIPMYRHSTST